MGVQQIATAAPLRGIPKGAAARLWHTTLLARYSVLYLCGGGIGDGCQPDALLISFLQHGCRLFFSSEGHMPGQSPPQGYTVSHLTVCVPSVSHHAKICAIIIITTLESR